MSAKSDRRAPRAAVAAYHQAQLAGLIARVGSAIDSYRAGELDEPDVDQALLEYSRAAKELLKFCNFGGAELTAPLVRELPPIDWWERGAPKGR